MEAVGGHIRIQKEPGLLLFCWNSTVTVFATCLHVKLLGMTDHLYARQRNSPVTEDFLAQQRLVALPESSGIVMPGSYDNRKTVIIRSQAMLQP
jgi:hypothetical protein